MKKILLLIIIILSLTSCKSSFINNIKNSDAEKVKEQLQRSRIYLSYSYDEHPLKLGIEQDNDLLLTYLIFYGFNADTFPKTILLEGKKIESALEYALLTENYKSAQVLLKDLKTISEKENKIISRDISEKLNIPLIEEVLSQRDYYEIVYTEDKNIEIPLPLWLIKNQKEELLHSYIKKFGVVNIKDSNGDDLVAYCVKYSKSLKLLEQLIKSGYSLNKENHNGYTPIYDAIKQRDHEKIAILYKYGADGGHINTKKKVSVKHYYIYYSEKSNNDKAIRMYNPSYNKNSKFVYDLNYIANNPENNIYGTPLMLAATKLDTRLVKDLLLQKVDTSIKFPYEIKDNPRYYNKDALEISYNLFKDKNSPTTFDDINKNKEIIKLLEEYNLRDNNPGDLGMFVTTDHSSEFTKYFNELFFRISERPLALQIELFHTANEKHLFLGDNPHKFISSNAYNDLEEELEGLTKYISNGYTTTGDFLRDLSYYEKKKGYIPAEFLNRKGFFTSISLSGNVQIRYELQYDIEINKYYAEIYLSYRKSNFNSKDTKHEIKIYENYLSRSSKGLKLK